MGKPIVYFGPHREPAVLVEDFGELRDGMVVWMSPCLHCGADHRYFLLGLLTSVSMNPEGEIRLTTGQQTLPSIPCRPSYGRHKLTPRAVAERCVHAVILERPANAETRETSKPRRLEKA